MKNPCGHIPGFGNFQFTASLRSSLCPSYSSGGVYGLGLFLALVACDGNRAPAGQWGCHGRGVVQRFLGSSLQFPLGHPIHKSSLSRDEGEGQMLSLFYNLGKKPLEGSSLTTIMPAFLPLI